MKSSSPNSGAVGGGRRGLLTVLVRGVIGCGGWFGRFLWDGLQGVGSLWVGPPPAADPDQDPDQDQDQGRDRGRDKGRGKGRGQDGDRDHKEPRPILDAPPAGHPERLVARTPLSRAEAELWARFYSDS
ncbi:DUF6059 family protein [Streptomyces sp. NPDC056835]|uniref:DUF6059 family protein n=1 Tax=Streptomyces sp. NPDC056835 TaxID=3345956 RepID=UPI00369BD69B